MFTTYFLGVFIAEINLKQTTKRLIVVALMKPASLALTESTKVVSRYQRMQDFSELSL